MRNLTRASSTTQQYMTSWGFQTHNDTVTVLEIQLESDLRSIEWLWDRHIYCLVIMQLQLLKRTMRMRLGLAWQGFEAIKQQKMELLVAVVAVKVIAAAIMMECIIWMLMKVMMECMVLNADEGGGIALYGQGDVAHFLSIGQLLFSNATSMVSCQQISWAPSNWLGSWRWSIIDSLMSHRSSKKEPRNR